MSYILDALRKSEQERHRDQLPQESRTRLVMPVKSPQPTGLKFILISILVLNVCAVIGGGLYLYFSRDQPATPAAPMVPSPSQAQVEPRLNGAEAEAHLRREGRPLPQRVMPPASLTDYGTAHDDVSAEPYHEFYEEPESILPDVGYINAPVSVPDEGDTPVAADVEARLSDKLDARLEQLRPREALQPLPITPETPASSVRPSTFVVEDGMEVIRPSSFSAASLPMPKMSSRSADVADRPESDAELLVEEPATPLPDDINTLPEEFRQQLPALTFNSHIYSSDPSSRRIMINNQYLREGQKFGAMRVREITPEGVVLFQEPFTFHVSVIRDWKP